MSDSPDLARLLPAMTQIVREAGEIAAGYFRPGAATTATIAHKDGGSPVTEADHRVDAFLRKHLEALEPAAGWLSEETADGPERLSRSLLFIVDPIDGTRAFMRGDPRWAVSVALIRDGYPALGIVHLPARGETFTAALDGGAHRNAERIRVSGRSRGQGALVAGPRTTLDALARNGLQFRTEPRIPSLAYRLVRVADGSLDVAIASTNACDWDIAAADLIIHEAGGRLVDESGIRPRYNRTATRHETLGAWSGQMHDEMQSALNRALALEKSAPLS